MAELALGDIIRSQPFQNGSIAFILLQLTLDDPKNDIATIAPIAQIMLTGMISNEIKVSLEFISQPALLASFSIHL